MRIRAAEIADVESMVRLSERFRIALSAHSPTFWRKADDSFDKQVAWFRVLLPLQDIIALVAESDSEIRGFVIGRLENAPPIYAPGGPVCLIDDFCVASDAEWASVGSELLGAVEGDARRRGAVLSVVICPRRGAAKRNFLREKGFEITTEWHIRRV